MTTIPWKEAMRTAIRSPYELTKKLALPTDIADQAQEAARTFRTFVPLSFLQRMEPGNPEDPLLRQVLPHSKEMEHHTDFLQDPLAESTFNPITGLLHKYKNRLLIFPSTQCAVNCRYCFRRHFPYDENRPNPHQWNTIFQYIQEKKEVEEVIYSGGDPLAIDDRKLSWITENIATIPHIKRLRVHSRLPIVIPERIDQNLLAWIGHPSLKSVLVIHVNHPHEINNVVLASLKKLQNIGVKILNQSVLLKGINDSVETLKTLNELLFDHGIIPYYIHLLDRVQGTRHFEVEEKEAQALMGRLSEACAGYTVPKLVREQPGMRCKKTVLPLYNTN